VAILLLVVVARSVARSPLVFPDAPTTVILTPRLPKLTVSLSPAPMSVSVTFWLLVPSLRVTTPPAELVMV